MLTLRILRHRFVETSCSDGLGGATCVRPAVEDSSKLCEIGLMDHPRRTQILESILSTVPGGEEFLQSVSSFRIDDELEVGNRGPDEWAIRWTNLCYTKDGRWLREPQPSNRTEEFITASRFPLREAFSLVDDAKRSIEAILDEEDRQYREGLR